MPVPRINVLVLAAALALACTSDSRRLDGETGLGSYEEVVLAESDTSFVGEIWGFAALENGGFVIADRSSGTLRVYDSKGREVSAIGRRARVRASGPWDRRS